MHVIQTDEEDNRGKIPNIIRRRSSIRYKPPTEPMDITPIISKSKSKRSKERRVTISRQVIETSYEAANVTGTYLVIHKLCYHGNLLVLIFVVFLNISSMKTCSRYMNIA